ncbi:hypothetical protein [Pontibacter sp. H249]|uniref:hypothetical protein n=1 Tax=Pontibacter sp. H249 TaxID=3133420 RepID=UPI0030C4FBFD
MKKLAILTLICLTVFWLYRANYFSSSSIEGLYINNNKAPVLEGPSAEVDTLKINSDFTFENNTWGKGTYRLAGDRITFSYKYEYGEASYSTTIDRPLFGQTIRIALNSDLEYYYEKIK